MLPARKAMEELRAEETSWGPVTDLGALDPELQAGISQCPYGVREPHRAPSSNSRSFGGAFAL